MNTDAGMPDPRQDAARILQLESENAVLMRRLGGLQLRISETLRQASMREDELQRENLRLRAEMMIVRTALFWGLSAFGTTPPLARTVRIRSSPDPDMTLARQVICRTGCEGHAHPWLDENGQCRQSGQACERIEPRAVGGPVGRTGEEGLPG